MRKKPHESACITGETVVKCSRCDKRDGPLEQKLYERPEYQSPQGSRFCGVRKKEQ